MALAAQVAVELAALDEVGERELVDRGRGAGRRGRVVGVQLRDQAGRKDEPAEPQGGRERLGAGAAVGDEVGREALQRSDRLAVVAELGVVVVFEDQRAAVARPGDKRRAALGRQDGAGRELVGGGDGDGVEVELGEAGGVEAVVVGGDRDGVRPASVSERPIRHQPGSSIADALGPARLERAATAAGARRADRR